MVAVHGLRQVAQNTGKDRLGNPHLWLAFATLTALELLRGIDTIVSISTRLNPPYEP